MSAGNTCSLADICSRQPVRVDMFGNIHVSFLHYVNLVRNRDFT
jgi:hypothetical protein